MSHKMQLNTCQNIRLPFKEDHPKIKDNIENKGGLKKRQPHCEDDIKLKTMPSLCLLSYIALWLI